jgi:hypothetical protein
MHGSPVPTVTPISFRSRTPPTPLRRASTLRPNSRPSTFVILSNRRASGDSLSKRRPITARTVGGTGTWHAGYWLPPVQYSPCRQRSQHLHKEEPGVPSVRPCSAAARPTSVARLVQSVIARATSASLNPGSSNRSLLVSCTGSMSVAAKGSSSHTSVPTRSILAPFMRWTAPSSSRASHSSGRGGGDVRLVGGYPGS